MPVFARETLVQSPLSNAVYWVPWVGHSQPSLLHMIVVRIDRGGETNVHHPEPFGDRVRIKIY